VMKDDHHQNCTTYVQSVLNGVSDSTLNLAIVDGLYRDRCSMAAIDKLQSGGMLLIDDAHRYLPSSSRSPLAIGPNGACATELWQQFLSRVTYWRCLWLSDGVHDDAIYIKP
jgi:hypothetical protein